MHKQTRIVGICQVRNEDVFIADVLNNIAGFCDKIIVADNRSTDGTAEIVKKMAAEQNGKIEYHQINRPAEAHDLIKGYAATPTWVFPVDGDEIYDPFRLMQLRKELFGGLYDKYRQLYGSSLHCVKLDVASKNAEGYLAPPCRTVTKLYNFNAIESWDGDCPERCHGGVINFKPGYDEHSNSYEHNEKTWDDSLFRVLHVCFIKRSSSQNDSVKARLHVNDLMEGNVLSRYARAVLRLLGFKRESSYKYEKYTRGDLVERDVGCFFEHRSNT